MQAKASAKSKNIVLLSDGTGNSAAKRHKTNVWRLYEALDLSKPDVQIAFYDDGVGSQEFLPVKLLAGAFGLGVARNVLELYAVLCRTYRPGDRIYLFGFSRGAFTVRMLAGFVSSCGLVRSNNDTELRREARRRFRTYRLRHKRGYLYRWVLTVRQVLSGAKREENAQCRPCIEFIGAWDTVDGYGFPVYELNAIWGDLVWPLRFVNQRLPRNVKRACHALSIDEERTSFRPTLWDETPVGDEDEKRQSCTEPVPTEGTEHKPPRIEQIWFAGVHGDVGGGYPKSTLALVTLDWMISKVETSSAGRAGLLFLPPLRDEYRRRANCHGVQHDSRSGLRAYYRYEPRNIRRLCLAAGMREAKVHRTALERIQKKVAPYAPTALPTDYQVVDSTGAVMDQYKTYDHARMKKALRYIGWRRWLYAAFVLATLDARGPAAVP